MVPVQQEHPPAPPIEARVPTGCAPLDTMLSGGLLPHRPYLVVGPSGTGKTSLALQFLCEGVRNGERCLLVTLEEPPNEMRLNHRGLAPELDQVYVFDAIPDVMRYERAPFKDIAAVRESVPFHQVPLDIRKTPELSSVEVTFTALEQTLKMETVRRSYSRMVIDSLTALQYFCMKGFDETLGAQTFLRFLSDLRVTTLLTVEAPLEDVETPERLLARGEIRLFRWELDGRTVRAIGVEKFRGSTHDNTLHPYRISPKGLDINLDVTISRDTRAVQPPPVAVDRPPTTRPVPEPAEVVEEFSTSLASLEEDSRDLVALGADVGPVRAALLDALAAAGRDPPEEVARLVGRARGRALELAEHYSEGTGVPADSPPARRLRTRAASARTGIPPSGVLDPVRLRPQVEEILRVLSSGDESRRPVAAPPATVPAQPVEIPAPPQPRPVPAAVPSRLPPTPVVRDPPRAPVTLPVSPRAGPSSPGVAAPPAPVGTGPPPLPAARAPAPRAPPAPAVAAPPPARPMPVPEPRPAKARSHPELPPLPAPPPASTPSPPEPTLPSAVITVLDDGPPMAAPAPTKKRKRAASDPAAPRKRAPRKPTVAPESSAVPPEGGIAAPPPPSTPEGVRSDPPVPEPPSELVPATAPKPKRRSPRKKTPVAEPTVTPGTAVEPTEPSSPDSSGGSPEAPAPTAVAPVDPGSSGGS